MINYEKQGAMQNAGNNYPAASPPSSALGGILERLAVIRSNLHDVHGIADRACGTFGLAEPKPSPSLVPNGMLDEIIQALDGLTSLSGDAVVRLGRIA